jgi:hypothetical protein
MPDYVVLISTLGGIVIFGINGFVLGPLVAAMFITVWDSLVASRPMDDNNKLLSHFCIRCIEYSKAQQHLSGALFPLLTRSESGWRLQLKTSMR